MLSNGPRRTLGTSTGCAGDAAYRSASRCTAPCISADCSENSPGGGPPGGGSDSSTAWVDGGTRWRISGRWRIIARRRIRLRASRCHTRNTDQRSGKNAKQKISTTSSVSYHSLFPLTGKQSIGRGVGANQSLRACFVGNFKTCPFVSTRNRVIRASSRYVTM